MNILEQRGGGFLVVLRSAPYPRLRVPLPLFGSGVCAGFPSPADDHIEEIIDLNELLVRNPPATFYIRAVGVSMIRVAASAVHVFLQTNPHRPELPQYFPALGRELLVPTSFTLELVGESLRVLEAIYRPGYRYIKAGVMLLGLVPDEERQTSLFVPVDRERERKQKALMKAADKLNLYFGRGTVRPASTGNRQAWAMRQNYLTPRYTTRIGDIPSATIN